jgi:hypothetical protein
MSHKPRLGYWKIRGLAEPIRQLLHYAKVDFEVRRCMRPPREQGGRAGSLTLAARQDVMFESSESWAAAKAENKDGLAFPNLPHWIEDGIAITQSTGSQRRGVREGEL